MHASSPTRPASPHQASAHTSAAGAVIPCHACPRASITHDLHQSLQTLRRVHGQLAGVAAAEPAFTLVAQAYETIGASVAALEALTVAPTPALIWREATDPRQALAGLTPRQMEVMARVLEGVPSKNIAAELGISRRTVENHRAAIMRKTGMSSLPALARLALAASMGA